MGGTGFAGGQPNAQEQMTVATKSVYIPAPDAKTSIIRVNSTYVGRGEALLQDYVTLVASDTFGAFYQRWSENNGRTWSEPTLISAPAKTAQGTERRGEGTFIFDERHRRVIRVYNHHIYPRDTYTREVMGLTTIQYEISTDGGKSFSRPRQLIVKGGTEKQWAPGVTYGRNCMMISFSEPFIDRRGRIVLPAQRFQVVPETVSPFRTPLEAACLIGEWGPDGDVVWTIGDTVGIDLTLSSRGVFEPAVAELRDGVVM
ncbi:MAG: sialidase family protein, partial [Verrucomicrobiota bacterium]